MIRQPRVSLLRLVACVTLCFGAPVLSGCMHTTKAQFTRHFDLGATTATAQSEQPANHSDAVLQIARFSVPRWLTDTAMHYRLDYRGSRSLAAYANSDWTAPPASLLETIVQRTLAESGAWRAVIGPGVSAAANATLHIRLDDFGQVFSRADASTGVVDATATLLDSRDDRVIAQRHFHAAVAAATPDAQGGVAALAQASRQFADEVRDWLRQASHH